MFDIIDARCDDEVLHFFISEIQFSFLSVDMTGVSYPECMRNLESSFNSILERFFTWWGVGKCTMFIGTANPVSAKTVQLHFVINVNSQ